MRQSYRYAGKIKPNTRQGIPVHCLYVDTETYVKQAKDRRLVFPLRLGVAIYNRLNTDGTVKHRFVSRFTTPQQFIALVKSYLHKGKTLYVFGHNIGFDIRVLNLPYLFNAESWQSNPPVINNRLFLWHITTPSGNIVFVDTANYGVISVSQLGADLHFPKLHVDFRTKDTEALFNYCQRDVEVIERFMQEYIRFIYTNQLGQFQLTLASQSLMAWRTRFMHHPVTLHMNEGISQFERTAYHGGRTECFRICAMPEDDYYYLDVNSMYPYVMKTYPMPTKLIGYSEHIDMAKLPDILSKYYLIAECHIKTDQPAYAKVMEDRLMFPVGEFNVTLHQVEIQYAYEQGHLLEIYGAAIYTKAVIFADYVDFFYQLKLQATTDRNVSWRYIAKLFLNSLYGKMGQLKPVRIKIDGKFPNDILRQTGYNDRLKVLTDEIIWFGTGWIEYKQGESTYSFPAIAGAVTAYARMTLYKYMETCDLSNVFYVDTDSMITNKFGYRNVRTLLSQTELGALKLEGHSKSLRIWGNKDYKFGRQIKTKGISHKAKKLNEDTWEQLQFQGFAAWMSLQFDRVPFATRIIKRRRFAYNKGVVDNETGVVSPIHLSV